MWLPPPPGFLRGGGGGSVARGGGGGGKLDQTPSWAIPVELTSRGFLQNLDLTRKCSGGRWRRFRGAEYSLVQKEACHRHLLAGPSLSVT